MKLFYSISIRFYRLIIGIAAIRNHKAQLWIRGRRGWRERISVGLDDRPVIWMHCASLGEFEQGRPVLESLKESRPDAQFLLTFYSPSGYEVRKDYRKADLVEYLPLDTRSNARAFVDIVKPEIALFVKYEFWPHFFEAIDKSACKLFLISGIFRPDQRFFRWYGGWFRRALKCVDWFFVQDNHSKDLLVNIGIENVEVSGDTRFDRVVSLTRRAQPLPMIERFTGTYRLLVVGSSWPMEEKLVRNCILPPGWKIVIAPHEIREERINSIKTHFPDASRYSESNLEEIENASVLIIDNVGMLSKIYQHADLAVIGGGFGKGVHNTLEAASWGVPMIVGPNNFKFKEIQDMRARKALIQVTNQAEFDNAVVELVDRKLEAGAAAAEYVKERAGATRQITDQILSTNMHQA